MLYKLALRNIMRAKTYYAFYFFIISIFTMILYSVILISWSISNGFSDFNLEVASISIRGIFKAMELFVIVLCLFFVIYIARFFIKRRSNELALYKLLGLNNRKILTLIGIENIIIISIAGIVGILFGVFFGRVFQQICLSIMRIDIGEIGINFSSGAFAKVIIMLIGAWLISYITPYIYVRKISISKLFIKKSEASKITKKPVISIILFFVSATYLIVTLTFLGSMLIEMIGEGAYLLSILLVAIICAFTLYKGFLYILVALLRKLNCQFRTPSLLLSLKHIETDTRQLYKLLALITVVVGIMTPFGLAINGVAMVNEQSTSQKAVNQFSYVTNDTKTDQAFLNSFSKKRNYETYSYEYEKVVTPKGIFYMINNHNAKKMLDIENPKNGLSSNYNNNFDFDKVSKKIENLSDDDYLLLNDEYTNVKKIDIKELRNLENDKINIEGLNLPKTLIQSTDPNYREIIANHNKSLKEFKKSNPKEYKKISEYNFAVFYNIVPLNENVTSQHNLIIANDRVFNKIKESYKSKTINLRVVSTNKSVLSNAFITDFKKAESTYKKQPLATFAYNAEYIFGLPGIIASGAISVFAALVYALLFFVLISMTLFRSLENGEKGNREYKIASLIGVSKASVLKGICLEVSTIMITPFILGFIVSSVMFEALLKQFLSPDAYMVARVQMTSIFGVMLPLVVVIIIIFTIVVRTIYQNIYKNFD